MGEGWRSLEVCQVLLKKGCSVVMPRTLRVSLDPGLCLLLLSAPANCGVLLQLFGAQTWHAESALARGVWVDSVRLDGKEPRQCHTWNFIFGPYTLQSQVPILLLSM